MGRRGGLIRGILTIRKAQGVLMGRCLPRGGPRAIIAGLGGAGRDNENGRLFGTSHGCRCAVKEGWMPVAEAKKLKLRLRKSS